MKKRSEVVFADFPPFFSRPQNDDEKLSLARNDKRCLDYRWTGGDTKKADRFSQSSRLTRTNLSYRLCNM